MAGSARQWRVLVAEDDADVAETLLDCLNEEGFYVRLATDGKAALEMASASRFDVLLTDLRMPRLDGRMLIRGLRQIDPKMPVVVMTGYAPPDWHSALQERGEAPVTLLEKPMRRLALLQALLSSLKAAPDYA
jgi:CheY-like chemotaxis protein